LGFIVAAVWRWRRSPAGQADTPPTPALRPPTEPGMPPNVRWELYLGGTFGVLLSFIVRASHAISDDIPQEALYAGLRALLSFTAFAFLERLAWTAHERVVALGTGALACFLYLFVADGINWPSL